jgi:hypothetical protein
MKHLYPGKQKGERPVSPVSSPRMASFLAAAGCAAQADGQTIGLSPAEFRAKAE